MKKKDDGCCPSYEAGEWIPGFSFGGNANGVTYNAQQGTYTKIGRLVVAHFRVAMSSKGTNVYGAAAITSLPHKSSANLSQGGAGGAISAWTAMTLPIVYMSLTVGPSSNIASFRGTTAANMTSIQVLSNQAFANNSQIEGTIVYHTDE